MLSPVQWNTKQSCFSELIRGKGDGHQRGHFEQVREHAFVESSHPLRLVHCADSMERVFIGITLRVKPTHLHAASQNIQWVGHYIYRGGEER